MFPRFGYNESHYNLYQRRTIMKRSIILFITTLFLTANTFTAAQEAPPAVKRIETVTIRGQFLDTEKKPVAGATVYHNNQFFSSRPLEPVITNERGEFVFEFPANTFHRFHNLFSAYSTERKLCGGVSIDFEEGKVGNTPIIIESIPDLDETSVTVVDAEGKPVEGAFVGAGTGYICGKTDAQGRFTYLYDKRLGAGNVFAFKPGVGFDFIDQTHFAVEGHFDIDKLPPCTNGPFHFKLDGKTVKVRVVDEDGRPVEGATVQPQVIFSEHSVHGFAFGSLRDDWDYRASAVTRPWQAKTDKEGIATFDWIPFTDITNISFVACVGWEDDRPITDKPKAFGVWRTKGAEMVVNAAFWDGANYNPNAEKDVWAKVDWKKIFDDIPVITMRFSPDDNKVVEKK
jgi:hypothetical protein